MIINDFLNFKLGVQFEDKYNNLAVEEVLNNKENYPLIYDEINYLVEYDGDKIKSINYDSNFFDCDDLDFCAGYEETMELYRAFLNAFCKDIKHNDFDLKSISFGVDYLRFPGESFILDPYFNYNGMHNISISNNKRIIGKVIIAPNIVDNEYYGYASKKEIINTYFEDNNDLMNEIKDSLFLLINSEEKSLCEVNIREMEEKKVKLEENIVGYPLNCFEFSIGKNYLKFITTKKDFNSFSETLKKLIEKYFINEEKENEIVKIICNNI